MSAPKRLEQRLNHLESLQERQMLILGNGAAILEKNRIKEIAFERNQAFENLRNELSAISGKVKALRHPAFEGCRHQVARILERDKILTQMIKDRRDELSIKMTTIQKGRRTLRGYQGSPNRPGTSMEYTG
ncbi:hypothetical protein HRM2_36910 [Desulforapulum autotrophicum HRM2]|uniref:Flagellar protein FlgN n=1 Tax=Desulforapulum autotrophicum (strain ATCC 43914 / DSM 3382 / VKM B-1955 / HRM2) TaxID=177437 RepID=C0QA31_DESAH|nr:hypothetical protein [Desulforapulum autotrophicum]ACN16749.1 hypothetical protein HRM2_36910 [Desulforapulum autotrophicum HRM2]